MHKYENNTDWIGRTIEKVLPIRNTEGQVTELEILFADGWISRLFAQGNIMGILSGPIPEEDQPQTIFETRA